MTALLAQPTSTTTGADADLDHWYCCDENRALCGTDLTNCPDWSGDDATCVVCADLDDNDAPCGPDCALRERATP